MGRDSYGEYGRCEAHSKTANRQCKQPAVGPHGKCYYHGGATPLQNGIYSDVVREEDRAILDALEDISTARKLEQTLNLQLMKLRRAVKLTSNPDEAADFWEMFEALVESAAQAEELDPSLVRELTQMLQAPDRSQRELMDLIRKTAKDLHKITDGETVQVDHGVSGDDLEELNQLANDLF